MLRGRIIIGGNFCILFRDEQKEKEKSQVEGGNMRAPSRKRGRATVAAPWHSMSHPPPWTYGVAAF